MEARVKKLSLLILLLFSSATAQIYTNHWARIKNIVLQPDGKTATLFLDYVEVFYPSSLKSTSNYSINNTFQENASDYNITELVQKWVKDVNKKLGIIKTSADTQFQIICLTDKKVVRPVDLKTFKLVWLGQGPAECWPPETKDMLVLLKVKSSQLIEITQGFIPESFYSPHF